MTGTAVASLPASETIDVIVDKRSLVRWYDIRQSCTASKKCARFISLSMSNNFFLVAIEVISAFVPNIFGPFVFRQGWRAGCASRDAGAQYATWRILPYWHK